jgi:hypothetical protein
MVVDLKPPTVTLVSPPANSTVSGTIKVIASAWDDVKVEFVTFHINGTIIATANESPYYVMWDTTSCHNGPADISVYSVDSSGNQSLPASRQVNVSNMPGEEGGIKSPFNRYKKPSEQ